MKNKKALSFIIAGGACALILFSVFVFPYILSAPPENRRIESIEPDLAYPSEDAGIIGDVVQSEDIDKEEQDSVASVIIDINAISEEKATVIATLAMKHSRSVVSDNLEEMPYLFMYAKREPFTQVAGGSRYINHGARYITAVDHINTPIWQVLYTIVYYGAAFMSVPDEINSEDYILYLYENYTHSCCETLSTSGNGQGVRRDFTYGALVVLDIDAFSGDIIGQGVVYLCDHADMADRFRVDIDADWRLINEYVQLWGQFRESDMSIPAPKSIPIPESFYNEVDKWKNMTRVPDLIGRGRTREDVEAVFSELGLIPEFRPVYGSLPVGTIAQISNLWEIVPEGTTIIVHVSAGRPQT